MAHLPPLNTIRMFDAAARHLNFRLAAEELNLTQGAVAQHVRRLEAELSVTLQWRLLLGTEVAKDKGFTMADLKVRNSPSRGEYLAVGGIAALAVIIAVAGFQMAA